jgi:hypothetical protein
MTSLKTGVLNLLACMRVCVYARAHLHACMRLVTQLSDWREFGQRLEIRDSTLEIRISKLEIRDSNF